VFPADQVSNQPQRLNQACQLRLGGLGRAQAQENRTQILEYGRPWTGVEHHNARSRDEAERAVLLDGEDTCVHQALCDACSERPDASLEMIDPPPDAAPASLGGDVDGGGAEQAAPGRSAIDGVNPTAGDGYRPLVDQVDEHPTGQNRIEWNAAPAAAALEEEEQQRLVEWAVAFALRWRHAGWIV
jgi:hypothetical protein